MPWSNTATLAGDIVILTSIANTALASNILQNHLKEIYFKYLDKMVAHHN